MEKFKDSANSFGPQVMMHSSISKSRDVLLPKPHTFFFYDQIEREHRDWHPQCNSDQICTFFLLSSLVCSRNAPSSAAGGHDLGSRHLLPGEALSVITASTSDRVIFPVFNQCISSNFCGHELLIKGTKFALIIHFVEFLEASGWEIDVQLHLEIAYYLQGMTKKKKEL